ncbi:MULTISPECIES: hypothetical protein [Amycolatopsis]|uniref:Uncharacterized protein n=1 Tax=Amycolatopsis dendrobii TaxID=2760662 RepID=A0A7W3VRT1_9PSEU|nr:MULTISPECIES: hypothetical protein [Amycolatopsis]MBB1151915.1 hypothetical protein [Amycolatopsis dendrobii]UKD57879.1 hypothetical protein L3Q65_14490 [Amycolatopsis sp. FU40]
MPTLLIILLVLGAGLFVGGLLDRASQTHARFTGYRQRTATGLITWVRSAVAAVLGVAGLLILLYLLITLSSVR